MATLTYTLETPLTPDPNFPSGYTQDLNNGKQTFDFTRNWFYCPIFASSVGGIAITDLSTMHAIRTVTLNQMYAGTPYGIPAGSPPTQTIHDLVAGAGTDLYMLTAGDPAISPEGEFCRFTRVNPVTMKVTGEWYVSPTFPPPITCVMPGGYGTGFINTTASHTIVAYLSNGSLHVGPQIFDGTGMAPIGMGPTPKAEAYYLMLVAGAKHPDGSCDFIMLDPDSYTPTTGNIDIWRINVSNSLTITSTKTGVLNILPFFTPTTTLYVGQLDYDPVHDTLMVVATGGFTLNAAPSTLMSVNYNGSVNWHDTRADVGGSVFNNGQYHLTNSTYMAGNSNNLRLYNTGTGAITFTGSIIVEGTPAGSFFHIWDAARNAYWTYALSRGFVRIDLELPKLALDDVVCVTIPTLERNLISLRWSDDRGRSYGSPVTQPMGEQGEYRTSLQWQRLAYARDRVFEVSWSVACRTALQGCWIDVTPAGS